MIAELSLRTIWLETINEDLRKPDSLFIEATQKCYTSPLF
jgi:hypothetical protein